MKVVWGKQPLIRRKIILMSDTVVKRQYEMIIIIKKKNIDIMCARCYVSEFLCARFIFNVFSLCLIWRCVYMYTYINLSTVRNRRN